jgi:hypothetical protein
MVGSEFNYTEDDILYIEHIRKNRSSYRIFGFALSSVESGLVDGVR